MTSCSCCRKNILLVFPILLLFSSNIAQPISNKSLVVKVNEAVNNLKSGSFRFVDTSTTIRVGEDTNVYTGNKLMYFRKIPDDTLVGYQLTALDQKRYSHQMYDGTAYYVTHKNTATLEVADKNLFQQKIKSLKSDMMLYTLFAYLNDRLQNIPPEKWKTIPPAKDTMLYNEPVYKLETHKEKNNFSDIYISKQTFLPIAQFSAMEFIIGNATEVYSFIYLARDINLTQPVADSFFSRDILTGYVSEKIYNPNPASESRLLAKGSEAPDWELPLIGGGTLKLSALKGRVVILDFWYKACAPCYKQMAQLQVLSEKYITKNVVIIGVNTFDDPVKDNLPAFLEKRNIKINSVYNGKKIEPLYGVEAAPTLFVINKEGKIAFSKVGSDDNLIEIIEKMMADNR